MYTCVLRVFAITERKSDRNTKHTFVAVKELGLDENLVDEVHHCNNRTLSRKREAVFFPKRINSGCKHILSGTCL